MFNAEEECKDIVDGSLERENLGIQGREIGEIREREMRGENIQHANVSSVGRQADILVGVGGRKSGPAAVWAGRFVFCHVILLVFWRGRDCWLGGR